MMRAKEAVTDNAAQRVRLRTRMLQGAGLVALMCVFTVFGAARDGALTIGQRLMIFSLASAGGAVGGIVYYATDPIRARGGWRRTVVNVLSILAYCFAALAFVALWVWLTIGFASPVA